MPSPQMRPDPTSPVPPPDPAVPVPSLCVLSLVSKARQRECQIHVPPPVAARIRTLSTAEVLCKPCRILGSSVVIDADVHGGKVGISLHRAPPSPRINQQGSLDAKRLLVWACPLAKPLFILSVVPEICLRHLLPSRHQRCRVERPAKFLLSRGLYFGLGRKPGDEGDQIGPAVLHCLTVSSWNPFCQEPKSKTGRATITAVSAQFHPDVQPRLPLVVVVNVVVVTVVVTVVDFVVAVVVLVGVVPDNDVLVLVVPVAVRLL